MEYDRSKEEKEYGRIEKKH